MRLHTETITTYSFTTRDGQTFATYEDARAHAARRYDSALARFAGVLQRAVEADMLRHRGNPVHITHTSTFERLLRNCTSYILSISARLDDMRVVKDEPDSAPDNGAINNSATAPTSNTAAVDAAANVAASADCPAGTYPAALSATDVRTVLNQALHANSAHVRRETQRDLKATMTGKIREQLENRAKIAEGAATGTADDVYTSSDLTNAQLVSVIQFVNSFVMSGTGNTGEAHEQNRDDLCAWIIENAERERKEAVEAYRAAGRPKSEY